ncbi:MAG TPA: septation protein IspZ [Caulobacteraceae bacterium]
MKGLFHAGKFLALDMASTLVYLLIYWAADRALHSPTKAVLVATPIGIAFGIGQIAWVFARKRRPDAMQWLSLFLVIATGTATFLTKDPRFILFKPSIIYCIVGAVMLKPGWMNRYLPERAVRIVPDLGVVFGFIWAALMFFSAALNLFVAMKGDVGLSVKFLAIYPLASKLFLFALQYAIMRYIGRRRYLAMTPEAQAQFEAVAA